MDKKYQVFVSSTYTDLENERREVIQGLLEMNCIPIAMELFPAANDDQWAFIERLIDDCDYYVVIVGGRYGSLSPEGISYTRKEYEYAVSKKVPVIGFLPKDPNKIETGKTDKDVGKNILLEDFKNLVQKKLCKFYNSPEDLKAKVITSMISLLRNYPRQGWVKSDTMSESNIQELLRLREKIDELEAQLSTVNNQVPKETTGLMQGEDEFIVTFEYSIDFLSEFNHTYDTLYMALTWNRIFEIISPHLIDEATETTMEKALTLFLTDQAKLLYIQKNNIKVAIEIYSAKIYNDHFQTIKIQLSALGLIEKSVRKRSIKDTRTYWKLTGYGEHQMILLRALRRENTSSKIISSNEIL
jgi:hypothetical protein